VLAYIVVQWINLPIKFRIKDKKEFQWNLTNRRNHGLLGKRYDEMPVFGDKFLNV
jgi:hypothetical protein